MLLYNVRKSNSGFTLIEMMVVTIIIGVIAAISVPNFLGLLNRNRANEAMRQVEGALKEAQKQALRTGKQCSITINDASRTIANPTTTPPTNGCLLSTRVLNDSLELKSSRETIVFSGKGNITIDDADAALLTPVLVMSIPNNTNIQKCVTMENVLGSIRTGDYSGTIPTTPEADSCVNPP
jgi:prepilin-type N-terminal cleavage/methylation domain-containing protein